MTDRPTVAVIGAGFSGVLTALRLLLSPDGPDVRLIERGPRFARGAAYSTGSPHHLLNVRATNMSAFVEQPAHFLEWLGAADADAQVFVTRDQYGQYLQSLLREATSGADSHRLVLEHDDARSLERRGDRWAISLGVGKVLIADAVVLAIGNLPPRAPDAADSEVIASRRYVARPWAWAGPELAPPGDVLLLGSGLTAVDVALSVAAARPDAKITALSRHGLLPRDHATHIGAADEARRVAVAPPVGSPLATLRQLRRRSNVDWRAAFDDLRPHVQGLWRRWSVAERRQFVRHLKPWWDVHRHRMAPQVAARIEALQETVGLRVEAGRLVNLRLHRDGVEASWTARHSGEIETRRFDLVVNCTGPRGDLERSADPLIENLFNGGLVRADACRLGIDVDTRSRVLGAGGEATPDLFAVGPISQGQYCESSSVPDIRVQAAECAEAIINAIAVRSRPAGSSTTRPARVIDELSTLLKGTIAEIDVELAALKYTGRVRNAWQLRGRRAAMGEIALWLDERRSRT